MSCRVGGGCCALQRVVHWSTAPSTRLRTVDGECVRSERDCFSSTCLMLFEFEGGRRLGRKRERKRERVVRLVCTCWEGFAVGARCVSRCVCVSLLGGNPLLVCFARVFDVFECGRRRRVGVAGVEINDVVHTPLVCGRRPSLV